MNISERRQKLQCPQPNNRHKKMYCAIKLTEYGRQGIIKNQQKIGDSLWSR